MYLGVLSLKYSDTQEIYLKGFCHVHLHLVYLHLTKSCNFMLTPFNNLQNV